MLFCTNHVTALATALAIGSGSGPFPVGAHLFVVGPYREPNCECGVNSQAGYMSSAGSPYSGGPPVHPTVTSTLEYEQTGEDGSGGAVN
jgi:hypothetical protein